MPSPELKCLHPDSQKQPLNFPNLITAIRIACIPGFVILLLGKPTPVENFWAAAIFGLGASTDWLDGYLARRTKRITQLGKIMDPVADKLIILSGLMMLVHLQRASVILAILLIGREVAVSGLRSLASSEGIQLPSNWLGKAKTTFEGFGVGLLILGPGWDSLGIHWEVFGRYLFWISVVLAVISGALYFRDYFRAYTKGHTP